MRMPAYVFDIDGTIADHSHRFHHLMETPKNWKSYREKVHLDEPILPIIRILTALASSVETILFLTGRREDEREVTKVWMKAHNIYVTDETLFMRPVDDFRPDNVVKKHMYLEHIDPKYYVHVIFEDRSRMVKTWRDMGLTCLQVCDGDY